MKNLRTTLKLFILVAVTSTNTFAQHSDSLNISGVITNDGKGQEFKELQDVMINLYHENQKVRTLCSDQYGEFNFKIPFDQYVVIEFEHSEWLTKRMLFDTKIEDKGAKIRPFNFEIVLLPEKAEYNYDALDFPITWVTYDPKYKDLRFNDKYTAHMLRKQETIISMTNP